LQDYQKNKQKLERGINIVEPLHNRKV